MVIIILLFSLVVDLSESLQMMWFSLILITSLEYFHPNLFSLHTFTKKWWSLSDSKSHISWTWLRLTLMINSNCNLSRSSFGCHIRNSLGGLISGFLGSYRFITSTNAEWRDISHEMDVAWNQGYNTCYMWIRFSNNFECHRWEHCS
jgi:hypothetical protein